MATPNANSVGSTGDPLIDGLLEGSSWGLPSNHVITYSLHTLVNDSVWTSAEIAAVDQAFATWEAVANIDFVRIGSPDTYSLTDTPADIAVSFTGNELSAIIEPGTLGLGVFPSPPFGTQILNSLGLSRFDYPNPEGDIFIDDFSDYWWPYVHPGEIGFETIIHEIGHTLGLKHPQDDINGPSFADLGIDNLDSVIFTAMSYNDLSPGLDYGYAATPMLLDILAVQEIYGPNMSYHTGNDVYALADDGILRTIWDAGGHDTFDAGDATDPLTIDLSVSNGGYAVLGDYSFTGIAIGAAIEDAIGGAGNDLLRGNQFANAINGNGGNDSTSSLGGDDVLNGGAGNDTLRGGVGNDRILGSLGDDRLNGGPGTDFLLGATGNDTYDINSALEINKAASDPGIDIVRSSVTYTLGAAQENLTLIGTGNIFATGNATANTLTGNGGANALNGAAGNDILNGAAGSDRLQGGAGADTLNGGAGTDRFVFNTIQPSGEADTIVAFNAIQDQIQLDDDAFTEITTPAGSTLAAGEFRANTLGTALDADDRILYNTTTGEVFYDADGNGVGLAVKLATLTGAPDIGAGDFQIAA